MELGDGGVHRVEVRGAIGRGEAGEGGFPDDAALDEVHDEEGRADDVRVLAQPVDARDGEAGGSERAHHAGFALDRVRAGEQCAGRLAAQHEGATVGGVEAVGRVGLAALELADRERAGEARDMSGHPRLERRDVEAQLVGDGAGAAIGLGPVHERAA